MPVPRAQRLVALDVFRGMTVAAMILVNNPGEYAAVYRPLQHAEWNGCTPTDLIFPFFLFITGVAIPFSLASTSESGWRLRGRITRRALVVFALGIFLNGFPAFTWSTLRIPGVLQRIALCYGCASLVVLELSIPAQALTALFFVAGYWFAMTWVPSAASPDANPAARLDNYLMHGHLLHDAWDPEGVLSTLPAIATTLCGALTGHWLRTSHPIAERIRLLWIWGALGLCAGLMVDDRWWPMNKSLWTGSFVLFTTGAALLMLGLCLWVCEFPGGTAWTKPFAAFGSNPIVAYVLSVLVAKLLYLWRIPRADGSLTAASHYVFERIFLPIATPFDASLLYAVGYTLLWLLVSSFLYRRHVLIRI
ncbi:MAG TPA: heparan-alpha-glucosaminide N-acetyltransferase domain-containing protein [Candidatus Binatia bacterium]|nr:heparan-alpha-glucosaminide N-acetyltransferase domain-containing protein [Candidatus Binatia bacterium]